MTRVVKTGDVEGDVAYTLGTGNRLQSWTGGLYTYDDTGCVTRIERDGKPTLDLTWNNQYQLVSVATNGVFAEGYSYDALGRRVATTTLEGSVRHIYDNNWQCIADVDVNGNVLCSYVWGDGIDNLLAVKIGNEGYTALTDVQGTVWGFTDGNGEVVARWTYDAWGNVLSSNVTVPALASLRYRFQGREWSAVTGLMNFRMRWYDAVTGRWLSKDPIRLEGGINLYVFSFDNPIMAKDNYGFSPSDIGYPHIGGISFSGAVQAGADVMNLMVNVVGLTVDVVERSWNMPNTAIGVCVGALGNIVGYACGNDTSVDFGHNALQFQGNSFMPLGAITLGNVIIYGPTCCPDKPCEEGSFGDHEEQHTKQGQILGPFYLPLNLFGGLWGVLDNGDWHGTGNFMEKGPQSIPPRPW